MLRGIVELEGCRENADKRYLKASGVKASSIRGKGFPNGKAAIMAAKVLDEIAPSESSSGVERRLKIRFACDGFAEVYAFETGFLFRGTIRDISQTGCYITTHFALKLEPLTEVDVLLILKNHEYRIPALVRNVRPGKGVGLEFLYRDMRIEASFEALLQQFLVKAPLR